jgi:hypothetical protein
MVVDDVIRFACGKSKEKLKSSSSNTNDSNKESKEPDYDEDVHQLEEEQEEKETGGNNNSSNNNKSGFLKLYKYFAFVSALIAGGLRITLVVSSTPQAAHAFSSINWLTSVSFLHIFKPKTSKMNIVPKSYKEENIVVAIERRNQTGK